MTNPEIFAPKWSMRKIQPSELNFPKFPTCAGYRSRVLSWCGVQIKIFWPTYYRYWVGAWTPYEDENLNSLEIQCPVDLEAAPGRKSSQGVEIDSQSISESWKIRKIRKLRKTAKNFRIGRFFDLQNEFSLCWRSKSCESRPRGKSRSDS